MSQETCIWGMHGGEDSAAMPAMNTLLPRYAFGLVPQHHIFKWSGSGGMVSSAGAAASRPVLDRYNECQVLPELLLAMACLGTRERALPCPS